MGMRTFWNAKNSRMSMQSMAHLSLQKRSILRLRTLNGQVIWRNRFHNEINVLLRINARGVYLIFLFLGGAFIRGGRLLNYLSLA